MIIRGLASFGDFSAFALRVLAASPYSLLHPLPVLTQLARFIAGMLGLVMLVGFSLGLVAWMHMGVILARFESQTLLPSMLMIAVVMEFGPIATGLLASSRLAAGLAAELSAMNAAEQLDAMECLGVSPLRRLIAPRVIAAAISLPLLTVVMDYFAFAGSLVAERLAGELTWIEYRTHAVELLKPFETVLATAKTAIFGMLVGLTACYCGATAERSAEAVGQSATRAVVAATLAVLLCNIFLVRIIQLLTASH